MSATAGRQCRRRGAFAKREARRSGGRLAPGGSQGRAATHVFLEGTWNGEWCGAPDADESVAADTGVGPHVSRQLARLRTGVRTHTAAVRFLAGVRATMNRQVAAVAEHLAAELARVVTASTATDRHRPSRWPDARPLYRPLPTTLRLPAGDCRRDEIRDAGQRVRR